MQQVNDIDRKAEEGAKKAKLIHFPKAALFAWTKAREYGGIKYGDPNTWKNSKIGVEEYLNAGARHILDIGEGEEFDEESGLPHVYHVLWNAAVAVWHYERNQVKS